MSFVDDLSSGRFARQRGSSPKMEVVKMRGYGCPRCRGPMFLETFLTAYGSVQSYHCPICGEITDVISERNRRHPPKPPERRGRKPVLYPRKEVEDFEA